MADLSLHVYLLELQLSFFQVQLLNLEGSHAGMIN